MTAAPAEIDALDLDPVKRKLTMSPEQGGLGWPGPETDRAIQAYRRFLKQVLSYRAECAAAADGDGLRPDRGPSPDPVTDIVWHTHILFTEKYHRDCARLFGDYIHHRPRLDTDTAAEHHPVGG